MLSDRPAQAGHDQGASPRLLHHHLSLNPALSTTQSSHNNKHHQHCSSNHSDDYGVAHNQLNLNRASVRLCLEAPPMQRLTSATSPRVACIQQPLLQPQSHSKSSPLTCRPANLHPPSLLSITKFPTSSLLQRLHVTSHQLICGFTVKKNLPSSRSPAVTVHAVNRCSILR